MNQPAIIPQPILTIEEEIEKLRTMYTADIAGDTLNCLILGGIGTGKTTLLRTVQFPCFIHSFDPGGTKVAFLKEYIERGDIIIDRRFETEDMSAPSAYKMWELEFHRLKRMNFFEKMGTYVIDSYTNWNQALTNQISITNPKMKNGCISQNDWQTVKNVTIDTIKLCTALPCDFILTAHETLTYDEVEGRHIARFASIPSLKLNIPSLFDEIYVTEAIDGPNGPTYHLLTAHTIKHEARTRVGAGMFALREEPDLMALKRKAGLLK